jgi:hypothetical protein
MKIFFCIILIISSFRSISSDEVTMYGKIKAIEGEKIKLELISGEILAGQKSLVRNIKDRELDYQYFEISVSEMSKFELLKKENNK